MQKRQVLQIKKLASDAYMPTSSTPYAAGLDLYACEDVVVDQNNKKLVDTGISIRLPNENYYGRIAPRSGLASKNFIDVGAGVIDYDYTGPLKVLLFNFSSDKFVVKKGDRIAQLLIEKILRAEPVLVDEFDEIIQTRGDNGFGSTGK